MIENKNEIKKQNRPKISRRNAISVSLLGFPAIAQARDDFPNRPIRFIVPYAPGGTGDIMSRLVADRLPAVLGQPVVVENRAGANGIIGADAIAKAPPDGHTIGLVVSSHLINKAVRPDVPFDPIDSFAPVCLVARTLFVLALTPSIPANNTQEFLSYVKSNPGKFSYASPGPGSNVHIFLEWFSRRSGLEVLHVPYRSSGLYHPDLLSGRVHFTIDSYASFKSYFESSRLRLLAVASPRRSTLLPDVPTIAESANIPGFDGGSWGGVLAPTGTPRSVIRTLNEAITAVVRTSEMTERLRELGAETVASSPEEFTAVMRTEASRFGELVREFGITASS